QLVAAMNDRHLTREPGQEQPFFERAVPTTDDHHLLVAEEEAVTRRAVAHAVAGELFLAGHVQVPVRRACADDDPLGFVLIAIIGLQIERATRTAEVCLGYRAEQVDARAETLRLRLHALEQLLPGPWLGEARI